MDYGSEATPLAIAHRGGASLALENSLAAFNVSYALGFRYLETDVRVTRDGVPVLFHDADLRRVFGRKESVGQMLYSDLPVQVPTLEAALRTFADARFTVDIKDSGSIWAISDVLRRTRAARRVCVAGAWDGTLRELSDAVGPDLSVAMGWRSLSLLLASSHSRVRLVRRGRSTFVHIPHRLGRLRIFVDGVVEHAHDAGVRIIVWTVNDPHEMHRLLDVGVDGIITDRPDVLREVLIARGSWLAPQSRHSPVEKVPEQAVRPWAGRA